MVRDILKEICRKPVSASYWWIRGRLRRLKVSYYWSKGKFFDWRHGTSTGTIVEPESLEALSPNVKHAIRYQPSRQGFIGQQIRLLDIEYPRFSFIDIGSGRGRVLIEAAYYPFESIVGVEFSPILHAKADENVRIWKNKRSNTPKISLCCLDATKFNFPDQNLIVYFYNPFGVPVMRTVLENIRVSLFSNPRRIVIIYLNPVCEELLRKINWLDLVTQGTFGGDRFQVYESALR